MIYCLRNDDYGNLCFTFITIYFIILQNAILSDVCTSELFIIASEFHKVKAVITTLPLLSNSKPALKNIFKYVALTFGKLFITMPILKHLCSDS